MLRTAVSSEKCPRHGFSLTPEMGPASMVARKSLAPREIHTFVTRRSAPAVTALTLLLGVPLTAAPAAAQDSAPAGVAVLVQESNGFPGGEKARLLSRQKVSVRDGRLRVLDPANGWALFISLPEKLVREVSLGRGEYEERGFEHYERYREDLARTREKSKEQFQRLRERAAGDAKKLAELEEEYRKVGGDPASPGKLAVSLEHRPADQRQETILVDLAPRKVTLEHWVVRENQQTDPTIDLWVAPELALSVDLLVFWRALVPFPAEVGQKLTEVKGAVVRLEATVDTGTFRRAFRSRLLEVRTQEPVPPEDLALPARWKKVDPRAAREAAESHICVMSGERLPLAQLARFKHYWVKKALRGELIQLDAKGGRPPHADAEEQERRREEGRED